VKFGNNKIMSRIGKKPINIPEEIDVKITGSQDKGSAVEVKNSKGILIVKIPIGVKVEEKDKELILSVKDSKSKSTKAIWGLSRTLINNAFLGLIEGYSKELEINGVGYKVVLQGNKLILNVGFSHPVEYNIPVNIKVEVEKNKIKISGIDKQLVGQVAAEIRNIKKPEPYKGKGIKYKDEIIRRKAGKIVKATE
tara:strand:- start:327 stop:911 length:585 start_codon:yes stop_codon:yes gene_type:complete